MAASRQLEPRGRKRASRGEVRIVEVMASLERLLQERSIAEVTVEDIAAGAGMSRSAFYFYFSSKHDALAAAAAGVRAQMIERAAPFLQRGDGDPGRALREAFTGVGEVFSEHRHVLRAVAEAGGVDPALRRLWREWIEGFVPVVAPRVEADRAAGRALPGPPAADLVRALLWLNERSFYHELSGPDPDLAHTVEIIATVWERAIYGAGARVV
jgi:AcrR family transcriptional regulator